MSVATPRLVIAAPSSSAGKTTVATGLMAALTARGHRVSPHKVGPDYIDPGYHALATGRAGRNLDPMLCGTERVAPLFRHSADGADVALVEGVMGLFDGAADRGEMASTAQVATLLRSPVVLVVDASAQSRSVAALVHGFAAWDTRLRVGGVILNRVASDRHEWLLRQALQESGVPVLGAVRRDPTVRAPARHLGLVPAAERDAEAVRTVRQMGELTARSVDLDALLALARDAPGLPDEPWDPVRAETGAAIPETVSPGAATPEAADGRRPRVAVAGGPAFSFCYTEHSELLTAAGADVVSFDPLRAEHLPRGTDALVLGGGFPEVYAAELADNVELRHAVAELAASGAPVWAECAGLLYLAESLDGRAMCGVLPGVHCAMTERLTLGYREAVALHDSALAVAGTRVAGHEFHRTVCEPAAGSEPAWGWHVNGPDGLSARREGFVAGPSGAVHASYLHLHWAGVPGMAGRLVAAARRRRGAAA